MSLPLQDSVTHNGDNRNGWKSISLNWLPPSDVCKMDNISFFATVVQKKDTFWVKIPGMVSFQTKIEEFT